MFVKAKRIKWSIKSKDDPADLDYDIETIVEAEDFEMEGTKEEIMEFFYNMGDSVDESYD